MQIGMQFRIQKAIYEAEENGVDTPLTDDIRQSCLSYHLQGVCNTHCGVQHLQIPLYQSEFVRLGKWQDYF